MSERERKKLRCDEQSNGDWLVPPSFPGDQNGASNGVQQPKTVLDLLPPEIWDIVLKNIEEPKDILNCCHVSAKWNDLLQDKKPGALFHEALPLLIAYLTKDSILKCGAVCRSWNKTIDNNFMEAMDPNNTSHNIGTGQLISLSFRSTAKVTRFLDSVSAPPVNPVVYRYVHMDSYVARRIQAVDERQQILERHFDCQNFYRKMYTFFGLYGPLVKCLTVHINRWMIQFHNMVKILKTVLRLTPNIVQLLISFSGAFDVRSVDLNIIDTFLASHPLPDLPQLKALKVYICPPEIYRKLLDKYGSQVENLEFGYLGEAFDISQPIAPLAKVDTFGVCIYNIPSLNGQGCIDLQGFMEWSQICPTKISIDCKGGLSDYMKDKLVELLRGHQAALQSLQVNNDNGMTRHPEQFELTELIELKMVELKNFKMTGFGFPSGEFLSNVCPDLELLEVYGGVDANETVYALEMYANDSFWKEMGKLVKIKVVLTTTVKSEWEVGRGRGRRGGGGRARTTSTTVIFSRENHCYQQQMYEIEVADNCLEQSDKPNVE